MPQQQPIADNTVFEVPPEDNWFLEVAGPNQEPLVFFRFQATGMLTRRVGPFPSRKDAAAWLSDLVHKVRQAVDGDLFNEVQGHVMILPWNHQGECVFLEDPFIFRPGPPSKSQPTLESSRTKRSLKKATTKKRKVA